MIVALRVYTVAAAVVVAAVGTAQWRRWQTFMPENQLGWLALAAFNAAALLSALRGLLEQISGSYATWAQATAVTFALIAALYRPWIWCRLWVIKACRRRRPGHCSKSRRPPVIDPADRKA